ncbi:MAG: serine/threonine protein kinase, partial [Pseudonocardia sp.]|nr:serine/threonine protein kinase [Pseudonocardia sp.]
GAETTAPTSTSSATPTPTPTPTVPPSTEAPPASSVDPVGFIQGYYSLLPGNLDAAWAQLSPQAQSASGGRGNFDSFYGGMESVSLQNVRSVGENTVEATVVFDRREGPTTNEPYRFVVSSANGEPILQSFSQLG